MLNKPKFGVESFSAGTDIIRQGDVPEKFYIITEGRVEVVRHDTASDQDMVMNYLEAGEYFGEIGMVNQSRRIATVRATNDVQVMTMNRETFANWMQESDMVRDEIEQTIARRIVNQKNVELVKNELEEQVEIANTIEFDKDTALTPTKPSLKRQGLGPRQFKSGDVILRQGDVSHTFYIIVAGRVEVVYLDPDDQEIHIAYLDEGSYFGEIGMLEARRRIATVRAVTDVELLPFDQETFRRWMAKSPSSYKDIEKMAEQRRTNVGFLSTSDDTETYKQQAAEKAVESVKSGMVVGLGTGSTAVYATRKIGQLLANGVLSDIVAIPTSEQTAEQARESGVPLTTLAEHPTIDLTIDGADEIGPDLNLIKGLGGALLREKIVAQASKQMIVIADYHKKVGQLGERAPVPVEVIPFAVRTVEQFLSSLDANPVLRLEKESEEPFITDEGNFILDCHIGVIADPVTLGQVIIQYPGVVEHGLFIHLATQAVVAGPDGMEILTRP